MKPLASNAPPCAEPPGPPPADGVELLESRAAESVRTEALRFALVIAVVVAGLAVVHLTPLRERIEDVQRWKAWLDTLGWWAPVVFVAASALLIALGTPRLLFCFVGGVAYGFWRGLILGQFASLFGAYGTFLLVRWGAGTWLQRRVARWGRFGELVRRPTLPAVVLLRQVPMTGVIPNTLLGMTSVRHRVFLAGSFLGFIPYTAVTALIGSGAGKRSLATGLLQLGIALGVSAVACGGVWILRRTGLLKRPASGR
jgi:uncharacterized membrane protein YdjX (TVP38/TMEM64 family)